MTGVIVGKRGKAYIIEVKLGSKIKKIITTKEHIMKYGGSTQTNLGSISSQVQAK